MNHQSLTYTYPWPDRRSRLCRLVDWVRRRPYEPAGHTTVYMPNVEVKAWWVWPESVELKVTAKPAEPLGPEWVELGYLTDGDDPAA